MSLSDAINELEDFAKDIMAYVAMILAFALLVAVIYSLYWLVK